MKDISWTDVTLDHHVRESECFGYFTASLEGGSTRLVTAPSHEWNRVAKILRAFPGCNGDVDLDQYSAILPMRWEIALEKVEKSGDELDAWKIVNAHDTHVLWHITDMKGLGTHFIHVEANYKNFEAFMSAIKADLCTQISKRAYDWRKAKGGE